jgi:hypothetical protein
MELNLLRGGGQRRVFNLHIDAWGEWVRRVERTVARIRPVRGLREGSRLGNWQRLLGA